MLTTILNNLTNIGWAMLIFLCAYLSNVAFSLYYNIKVLLEPFDRGKAINSALKVTAFVTGLTLLCLAVTTLPLFANMVGWDIPAEYADIFKRFYRSPSAQNAQGTGLGLPLARAVIEGQGGMLSVQSAPHQGAAFTAAFLVKPPLA